MWFAFNTMAPSQTNSQSRIHHSMKYLFILLAALSISLFPACEGKKGPVEKAGEKVDDALDNRPAEKLQDAGEDIKDAVKDATN